MESEHDGDLKMHLERLEQTGPSPRHTFTKSDRLLRRGEFLHLKTHGKKFQNKHFIVYVGPNDFNHSRLGITVTRKVGKAATRNRIKRIAREYFRQHQHIFRDHWDINLIAKVGTAGITNKNIVLSLENIFERFAAYQHE